MDTVFWVAVLIERDQYGDVVLRWKAWIDRQQARMVTTEPVLWELLSALAAPLTRRQAAGIYRLCQAGAGIEWVPFERRLTDAAFALYEARRDKFWSLTDCFSFVVMQERGLTAALTADHHFVQPVAPRPGRAIILRVRTTATPPAWTR